LTSFLRLSGGGCAGGNVQARNVLRQTACLPSRIESHMG